MKKKIPFIFGAVFALTLMPLQTYAMHIMEGYLPPMWAGIWGLAVLPFLFMGLANIKKMTQNKPQILLLIAMAGAFAFVLSALKLPSVTGSCSHPTGVGLGAILFGPTTMSVLGLIVLLFQALLLAHGGITTLGANTFSMGVVGPIVSFVVYKSIMKLNGNRNIAVFLAAALGDLLTYVTTAIQLGLAHPSEIGGATASIIKFLGIFAVTQVPLAISEGILTVIVFNAIMAYNSQDLINLNVLKGGAKA